MSRGQDTTAVRERELIDTEGVDDTALRANLRDQMRLNRILGGNRSLVRQARPVLLSSPRRTIRILDAGCGGGELSRALVDAARRLGRPVMLVALDRNRQVLQAARQWSASYPEITHVRGDLDRLPLGIGTAAGFDLTICANTLHHLEPAALSATIGGLAAVTYERLILSDLRPSACNARLFPLLARVLALHPMSRHDGAVSLRHALAADELEAAASEARLSGWRLDRNWFRLQLTWDRP